MPPRTRAQARAELVRRSPGERQNRVRKPRRQQSAKTTSRQNPPFVPTESTSRALPSYPPEEKPKAHATKTLGKRPRDDQSISTYSPPAKRQREVSHGFIPYDLPEKAYDKADERAKNKNEDEVDAVAYWAREGRWPTEYFTKDPEMERLLARQKSFSSSSRKRSRSGSATSVTPSDQKPREEKTAPYRTPQYKILLESKGSFMDESPEGLADDSRKAVAALYASPQSPPENSLFRHDIFRATCRKVADRNEARVIRDITPLLVPSAENLAIYGASELNCLVDSTNEGWNCSIALTGARPQPDYSVGFGREAFTSDQLGKLEPIVGDVLSGNQSFFMATYMMYFPFLTCEVKCSGFLDVADRQNAHSATLAVRGVVELFRLVKRQKELNRQILAFSVSHDNRNVRIYGHYPEIDDQDNTRFYRYLVDAFDFTSMDGANKWKAYSFTKNVYTEWMPTHLKRICSAIDQIPSALDFDVPPLASGSGLSQEFHDHHLSHSDACSVPSSNEHGDRPPVRNEETTPDTSFTSNSTQKARHGAKTR